MANLIALTNKIRELQRQICCFIATDCAAVNTCLGISPDGDPTLVLNQQGDWILNGSGSISEPDTQIVYGTGAGVSSSASLTYDGNLNITNGDIKLTDENEIDWSTSAIRQQPYAIGTIVTGDALAFISSGGNNGYVFFTENSDNNIEISASTGQVLISNLKGNGTGFVGVDNDGLLSWQANPGSPAVTSTHIAFGNGSNQITDSANFTYDPDNSIFNVGFAGGTNINIDVTSTFGVFGDDGGTGDGLSVNWGSHEIQLTVAVNTGNNESVLDLIGDTTPSLGYGVGATANRLKVDGTSGQLILPLYGSGTFTGTVITALGADASGNIVEFTPGGTASLTSTQIGYGDTSNLLTGDNRFIRNGWGIQLENIIGGHNIFIGTVSSPAGNITIAGSQNTAVGESALVASNTTSNSAAFGDHALSGDTDGQGNSGFGTNALNVNSTGINLTALGFNSNVNADGYNNSTALGAGSTITMSNQFVFGTVTEINWNIAGLNYIMPTSLGASGSALIDSDGAGTLLWQVPSASLASTQIGFGDGSNLLTGDVNYTYDNINQLFNVGLPNALGAGAYNFINIAMPTDASVGLFSIGDIAQTYSSGCLVFDFVNGSTTLKGPAPFILGLASANGGLVSVDASGATLSVQATGWGTPTGTLSRTTFDPSTISYLELAQKVAALITDLETLKALHS